ncbi:hypothetical protein ALC57_03102 [Trachymyrmex cornetzi]|uniref:Uncharacterized protein n=1 Tax=Trachymyrmex cornetzi TaxID=471704 RepID=A0A151JME9_9HYME|nr:hypothetical protein ALC57_03102 [Trachymyrmex cornetzi]
MPLKYTSCLVSILLCSMKKRFNNFINLEPEVNDAILVYTESVFILEAKKHNECNDHNNDIDIAVNTNVNASTTTQNDSVSKSFFSFQTDNYHDINELKINIVQLECMKYFQDKLFSYGGLILRSNRRSMKSANFERMILIKANNLYL